VFNRCVNVGAEKHIVLAVCEEDQSGVVAGTKDGETGVSDQPAQCRRAVAVDRVDAGTFDDGLD
jgi:hypothetical protein